MKGNKILIRYLIITVIIALLAILHASFYIRKTSEKMINIHINSYREIMTRYLEENAGFRSFISSGNMIGNEQILKDLSHTLYKKDVFDAKIWNGNDRITWQNPGNAGGTDANESSARSKYLKAVNGTTVYNIRKAGSPGGWILDAFLPISFNNDVIGVLELHQHVEDLGNSVNETTRRLWMMIIITALVFYLLLFLVFFQLNRSQNRILEKLEQTQDVIIYALAYQAEQHDHETGGHLDRVSSYVRIIVDELKKKDKYREYCTDDYVKDLVRASHLHDIGKVGIPDAILKKPGRVSPDEYEIIKKHCDIGVGVLKKALSKLSIQSFLDIAVQLVGYHHEKWDGTGYPEGLKGEEIPLSGRIMALADVYDALRSERIYKNAFPHDECVKIIENLSGIHFDPDIVRVFLLFEQEFFYISET